MSEISKNSTFEEKVAYLREKINDSSTDDAIATRNIFCLVSARDLSDEFLESDKILFKDIEEFSDIATELKPELNNLRKELATYYLSTIISCRSVYFLKSTDIHKIPVLYSILIGNLGMFSLNALLAKQLEHIDLKKVVLIDNAFEVMAKLIEPLQVFNSVITQLVKPEK